MVLSMKKINGVETLTIFTKRSILDEWLDSEYSSGYLNHSALANFTDQIVPENITSFCSALPTDTCFYGNWVYVSRDIAGFL